MKAESLDVVERRRFNRHYLTGVMPTSGQPFVVPREETDRQPLPDDVKARLREIINDPATPMDERAMWLKSLNKDYEDFGE
jgi:hypothetical protein